MKNPFSKTSIRTSQMDLNQIYFWTVTVKNWYRLLSKDKYKQMIIDSLATLVAWEKLLVYGFVIMPNHFHLILKLLEANGKEYPHANLNKFSAHQITRDLKTNHPKVLSYFFAGEKDRIFRIWKPDPWAIIIDSKIKVEQKLIYIHNNPLQSHWNLATKP